jgi:small-conductance mechanosensitive channel
MAAMETKLLEAFAGLGSSIVHAIPGIAVGILLIILGLVIAKLIEIALRTMLVRVRVDRLTERTGVTKALRRIGIHGQLNVFLPKVVYFLVIFLLAKTVSDALGLIAVSNAIGAFFTYLPNIVAALLLLILGITVGQFTGRMATQAAKSSGIDSAPALGRLVATLIIFIAAMMAMAQLKIDTGMIRIVSSFVLGAGALAFGVAFGLGTREIVRNIVTGFYARKFLAIGKSLEIGGQSGTLTAITATHSILTREGQDIVLPNSTFLEQASKQ